MDSLEMQAKFVSLLRRQKHDFILQNINILGRESDIFSVKNWEIYEFEFKTGESDFRKDIKKNRHQYVKPHYFHYVVKDESIINGEYLKYAGIYVHTFQSNGHTQYKLIKPAERIRGEDITSSELYSILKKRHA